MTCPRHHSPAPHGTCRLRVWQICPRPSTGGPTLARRRFLQLIGRQGAGPIRRSPPTPYTPAAPSRRPPPYPEKTTWATPTNRPVGVRWIASGAATRRLNRRRETRTRPPESGGEPCFPAGFEQAVVSGTRGGGRPGATATVRARIGRWRGPGAGLPTSVDQPERATLTAESPSGCRTAAALRILTWPLRSIRPTRATLLTVLVRECWQAHAAAGALAPFHGCPWLFQLPLRTGSSSGRRLRARGSELSGRSPTG